MQLWEHVIDRRAVAMVLLIESVWSLAVMIDRYLYSSAARKQSRELAPKVAGALKESKLEEAIKIADRNKKSHLAGVSRPACGVPRGGGRRPGVRRQRWPRPGSG